MVEYLRPQVKKTLRAGIIGCGQIGSLYDQHRKLERYPRSHAKAYFQSEIFKLEALCDPNLSRLEHAATLWEVSDIYQDVDAFLEHDFDVISVCVPVEHQFEVIRKIAVNPPHALFLEKPVGRDLTDYENIVTATAKMNTKVLVNFSRRFSQNIQKIKSELQNQHWGHVQNVIVNYDKGILNNASHALDIMDFFFGTPQKVLYIDTVKDERVESGDPTKSFVVWYKHINEGEFKVYFNANHSGCFSIFEIDIVCERGRIKLFNSANSVQVYQSRNDDEYSGYKSLHLIDENAGLLDECFSHSMIELQSIVQDEQHVPLSPVSSSRIIHLVLNALKSSEQKCRTIDI